MSEAKLQLTYKPDDEWVGELTAVVRSGMFSGKGTAWFDRTNLKESFLAAAQSFPFSLTSPPTIEGGFWTKGKPGSLDQCHIRIVIKPYGLRGTLLVHVDLASESWKSPDVDLQNSATIRFLTEYEAVNKFAKEIVDLLDGAREQAILTGTLA